MNRYTAFFAEYNKSVKCGNPNSKEETVAQFTGGRTDSLKDLSDTELRSLTDSLRSMTTSKYVPPDDKADKMRKSIIAIFKDCGKSVSDAKAWAKKQGVYGVKKKFNEYTRQELFILIRVAEQIRISQDNAIRKKLSRL